LKALQGVFSKMSATDKANLLGDQFALFVANRSTLADYLDLLPAMRDETNIAVWQDTLSHLARLDKTLADTPEQAAFHTYAIGLIKPEFERLGWDPKPGESFLNSLLRPDIIAALGRAGDPAVIAEANKRFAAFLKDPASLPPALRTPVLDIVGHHADQATYDTLKKLGTGATSTEEKLRYFGAMASATDPALMKQSVAFATSGAVPNGRITTMIYQASLTSGKADELYQMVVPHEGEFAARMPADGLGPTVLVAAAAGSSNPETAKTLLAAKSSQASIGAKIWAARVADGINTAAELKARTVPVVAAWLKANQG
jgi:hypothetical protein